MSLLSVQKIYKRFGAVEVLRGVTFTLGAGEVVGLVGDNGAGKSTLMKIITGVHSADVGQIYFDGHLLTVPGHSPARARALGIEMVYQDLALARQQDVAANVFLGREPQRHLWGWLPVVDRVAMEMATERVLSHLGVRLPDLHLPVGRLSGGQQQTVAIARALTFNPKLLILDEPTAALAVREVEHVLDVIRELKRKGISVVLISHRLPDVFAVTDRILVLRQGVVVADFETRSTTMSEVVSAIVGAKG